MRFTPPPDSTGARGRKSVHDLCPATIGFAAIPLWVPPGQHVPIQTPTPNVASVETPARLRAVLEKDSTGPTQTLTFLGQP